ncbi:AAA family ATPase [Aliarcobacter cibarius]|uniref:ATP-binding protein n=1 Tax=Aliarcobacter cibarius TaxID=255507 RepID=A0A5J6RGW5_9BACT|nr:AAA family ATPase [Aliarcobacter cibarius]QEZ89559.1 ATP-binding protein (AAA domain) [Aliarcobacter cibarius]QKJ27559.1 ATP-binding protein (AAA domain) [Aliarcobacter cibarius]TLS96441.1 ATP-binding protein [Aliarcobacter cibarius]TLS96867.1 ATP-binding protein [Aliarcobacter cibarius]TLT03964.1 ATP-binding protein [Aliarcobacter cibarius]
MKLLEENYQINFSKINFLERKIKIINSKTIICGPSKVGKSYLVYDFLSNFKNEDYLYIDFFDLRNKNITNELQFLDEFIKEKNVEVLILENFDHQCKIPDCTNIILTSQKNIIYENFEKINLYALDFEEYLLFDSKHQNITQSFNSFLKYGNLALSITTEEHKKLSKLQEIIKLNSKDETSFEILKILIENIDERKSIFQLYNQLKTRIKISKDRFYEECKELEEKNNIFFIEKYNQEMSLKKIYTYNYAFLNAISFTKKFKQEFTNMVFLELLKENNKIFYLENIDFYVKEENLAVVCIPFFNQLINSNILKKIVKTAIEYNINKIEIITVSNSENLSNNKIKINVISFYEWALS